MPSNTKASTNTHACAIQNSKFMHERKQACTWTASSTFWTWCHVINGNMHPILHTACTHTHTHTQSYTHTYNQSATLYAHAHIHITKPMHTNRSAVHLFKAKKLFEQPVFWSATLNAHTHTQTHINKSNARSHTHKQKQCTLTHT